MKQHQDLIIHRETRESDVALHLFNKDIPLKINLVVEKMTNKDA